MEIGMIGAIIAIATLPYFWSLYSSEVKKKALVDPARNSNGKNKEQSY